MNKIIKQALAGVAALGIAASGLALGVGSAYAADLDPTTGNITINKSNEDQIEHTFSGWHLASLTSITKNADGNISGFLIDTDDDMVDTIVSAMTDEQKSKYQTDGNYYSNDDAKANPMGYLVEQVFKDNSGALNELDSPWGSDSSPLRAFAKSLSEKLAEKNAPAATSTELKTGENKNLTQGLWFLKDTTTANDVKGTNSIPIITPTTFEGADWGTVTLKNTTPTIDKQLVDKKDDGSYTPNTQPDYAVGDTVTYELTSTIPTYTGYDIDPTMQGDKTRVFKINDTASKALTVDQNTVIESVKLTKGDQTVTLNKDTDYTVSVGDYTLTAGQEGYNADYVDGHVTTIDLGKYVNKAGSQTTDDNSDDATSVAKGILEGATVTVIVKTTLNKDALISTPDKVQGNPNMVDLEYSNKPENVSDAHKVPGPEVNVYAYKFGIHKTDKAGTTPLEGAKFTIKAVSGTTNHNGKYLGTYTEATGWSYVDGEPAANATEGVFTTNKDGNIAVSGLDAGVYEIHEIAPPTGYTSVGLPTWQITIAPTMDDKTAAGHKTIATESLTITQTSAYVDINDKDGAQLDVWNAKNITELPKTGGAGLALIVVVGGLFIAAAGIFGLRSRRNA